MKEPFYCILYRNFYLSGDWERAMEADSQMLMSEREMYTAIAEKLYDMTFQILEIG